MPTCGSLFSGIGGGGVMALDPTKLAEWRKILADEAKGGYELWPASVVAALLDAVATLEDENACYMRGLADLEAKVAALEEERETLLARLSRYELGTIPGMVREVFDDNEALAKERDAAQAQVAALMAHIQGFLVAPSGVAICACRNVNAVSAGLEKACWYCEARALLSPPEASR